MALVFKIYQVILMKIVCTYLSHQLRSQELINEKATCLPLVQLLKKTNLSGTCLALPVLPSSKNKKFPHSQTILLWLPLLSPISRSCH